MRECPKPVIAMINGHCFGGGFGVAAAAGLRMASRTAVFSIPAARLGLAYPVPAVADLVQAVGAQTTMEMLLTAGRYSAEEMLRRGFLLNVCEAGRLEAETIALAGRIAENAPATIHAAKLAVRALQNGDFTAANQAAEATFESADYAEGRAAFRERRKPGFDGV